MKKKTIHNLTELAAQKAAENPRTITPMAARRLKHSLATFGDLGGIVYNETTQTLVGGHQRVDGLQSGTVTLQKRYQRPDKTGTVALGVIAANGTEYAYRVVRWTLAKQRQAMIAANNHGGEFADDLLAQLLKQVPNIDFDAVGMSEEETEKLLKLLDPPPAQPTAPPKISQTDKTFRFGDVRFTVKDHEFTRWRAALIDAIGTDDADAMAEEIRKRLKL